MAQEQFPEELAALEGHDPTMEVVHRGGWTSFEEGGWMFVLRKEGRLFVMRHESSVYSSEGPVWDPQPVSEDEALAEIEAWDRYEQQASDAMGAGF